MNCAVLGCITRRENIEECNSCSRPLLFCSSARVGQTVEVHILMFLRRISPRIGHHVPAYTACPRTSDMVITCRLSTSLRAVAPQDFKNEYQVHPETWRRDDFMQIVTGSWREIPYLQVVSWTYSAGTTVKATIQSNAYSDTWSVGCWILSAKQIRQIRDLCAMDQSIIRVKEVKTSVVALIGLMLQRLGGPVSAVQLLLVMSSFIPHA
ncbi:uncharacterized protein BJ212DRAFT_1037930 [Suillus subaureus]|uniref:Uncharacterized protein n=1 Tax=Suillus subaureus TaxID=48587 RepID=A0A9P7JG50_9AGAM|nr:uncharacterized protein BJ212DRAFT_1037930 [Suillus subaureus]KAG1820562.1 hypothetical protein BJ212DRAFT_1037930 [Suillus subaureus]